MFDKSEETAIKFYVKVQVRPDPDEPEYQVCTISNAASVPISAKSRDVQMAVSHAFRELADFYAKRLVE